MLGKKLSQHVGNALSYLFPRIIFRGSSPYNNDIRVTHVNGSYQLSVNGIQQTGSYIQNVFNKTLREYGVDRVEPQTIRHILILGVGGGYIISLLQQYFPEATITAVDIDKTMLFLAQKYFGITDVEFIVDDAAHYVQNTVGKKKKFDLIFIDLYIGGEIPIFEYSEAFISNIHKLCMPHGRVLINFDGREEFREQRELLLSRAKKIFPHVEAKNIMRNCEILLSVVPQR